MTAPKFIFLFLSLSLCMLMACDSEPVDPQDTEQPKMSISSATFFEGDENFTVNFKVSLSAAHAKDIQVNYATEEITAGEGIDFIPVSGVLTIPMGEREGFIEVEIVADSLKEQDEEFKVVLSNPVEATIFNGEGIGTIRNDDTFLEIPEDGYITPESYTGFDLVWRDEFEGNAINTSDWTHEIGGGGWGNEELQFYTDRSDNSFVTNGNLVIEAKEENFSGRNYTSARMITLNKQSFQFGRVDIRAILPEGQGIWPALWMLGTNIQTIGWPACGEIDIMELVGHEPDKTHGTIHWGPQGQTFSNSTTGSYSLPSGKFSDKYHVFSISWEPNEITWYLDDQEFFKTTAADVNGSYPFNADFFFIFNVAVGGRWPGSPDATTSFPQRMTVDYIRVFQRK